MVTATEEMTRPDEDYQQTTFFTVPSDVAFENMPYRRAPELDGIARDLIGAAEELNYLSACRVRCYWKRKGTKQFGNRVMGGTGRASDILRMELKTDFVIWLAADFARDAKMTEEQINAAMFDRLSEIGEDDSGNYIKVKPDLQVFSASLVRYGPWRDDVRAALARIPESAQRTLFDSVSTDDEPSDEDLADLP